MHARMDRSKMRVWMCECDECRMLWIRGVLVRRHPIAVEAPAKLQPFPTLLLPARFSSKAVTDALVSKHVQLQIAKGNRDADCWAPKVRCTC